MIIILPVFVSFDLTSFMIALAICSFIGSQLHLRSGIHAPPGPKTDRIWCVDSSLRVLYSTCPAVYDHRPCHDSLGHVRDHRTSTLVINGSGNDFQSRLGTYNSWQNKSLGSQHSFLPSPLQSRESQDWGKDIRNGFDDIWPQSFELSGRNWLAENLTLDVRQKPVNIGDFLSAIFVTIFSIPKF